MRMLRQYALIATRNALHRRRAPVVHEAAPAGSTSVDAYWADHTVNSRPFRNAKESREYLEWRFDQYPRYRELMGLWGDHHDEVVLDYGCGPGDDTVGLLLYSGATQVIGVDISARALELARRRIALHAIDEHRVHLIRIGDADPTIPLDDSSVDVVHCSGVLHHTSDPESILREFHRILKPHGRAQVMVYNRDSVWFHLYTAYVRMIHEGAFAELSVDDAFARNTDGPDCPISRCYRPAEFLALGRGAGLEGVFAGGYLSRTELAALAVHRETAQAHPRLGSEHRQFLRDLVEDESGLPTYRGLLAGIGGTFHLKKP